jgi:hypothetical protein
MADPTRQVRRLRAGAATRGARIADLIHRLSVATAEAHRYVHGPFARWGNPHARQGLADQVEVIEHRLARLATEVQVLLLTPDPEAKPLPKSA